MHKRHTWIHTENPHACTFMQEGHRGKETYRLTGLGENERWDRQEPERCAYPVKQCMLVIQKIESERCFRERQWIKCDPLFLNPPVVSHSRIKAVWELKQGPLRKNYKRKVRLSAKVCWWRTKGQKKKECDPFQLMCNESEIRLQAWTDNNN